MDVSISEYPPKILVLDPSGRGKDETGYAVLYQLNGYLFLMEWVATVAAMRTPPGRDVGGLPDRQ